MTTYRGESLSPTKANEYQSQRIQRILDLKNQAKDIYKEIGELFAELPVGEPMVAEIQERQSDGFKIPVVKTFIVDKPTGHHVVYKEVEFTMNAKTTKKDLKEIESN